MPAFSTRDTLIAESIKLLSRSSFGLIGVDQVVRAAGVSKATFYNHFDSKEDLFVAVLEKWSETWRLQFKRQLIEHAGDEPLAQLRSVFSVLSKSFDNPEDRGFLFFRTACLFTTEADPIYQVAKANIDAVRGIIIELADNAGISQPYEFAKQFHLVIHGVIAYEAIYRRSQASNTAADVADKLIDSFLDLAV